MRPGVYLGVLAAAIIALMVATSEVGAWPNRVVFAGSVAGLMVGVFTFVGLHLFREPAGLVQVPEARKRWRAPSRIPRRKHG